MENPKTYARIDTFTRILILFAALPGLLLALAALALGVSGSLRERAVATIREKVIWRFVENSARDIDVARMRADAEGSARIVNDEMRMAKSFIDRMPMLELALAEVDPKLKEKGLYAEFGVSRGESINFIAERIPGEIHGFDSFEGLPEDWNAHNPAGTFKLPGLPPVRKNVKLHKGWFDQVIPGWSKQYQGPFAFLHMDADLYSSTKTVFEMLGDRIVAGTVIQFDELLNYPGWQDGEWKAFRELRESRHAKVKYLGYVNRGQPVAMKVLEIDPVEPKR